MARVLVLDEEIERDVDGVGDVLFSRLGEPVPLTSPSSPFDLSDPPRNPLAVSFSARLLFVALSHGFMVAETPEVIRMAKEIKEKGKGPSVLDSCFLDVKIGKVSILALSVDSLWLAAVVGCDVRFYSIENLRNKVSTYSFLCSIKSGVVKDFKWQKNTGNAFAVLSSDGLLQLGQLQDPLKDVMNNVDAVDWSENGAFIAAARKNMLSIWSLDLKEQCQMKLLFQAWSDGTDSECSIKVDSINWLRNNSIVIGCVRVYEDGKEEGCLVQVVAVGELEFIERSSKPVVFSFPDLFEDISDDILSAGCGPYLFASYLKHLGLTLASFKKAIGAHLLLLRWSLDDDRREAVSLEYENEIYTPRIDLQENGNDNLILGFVVDQTPSNEKVRVKIEADFREVFPNCTIWCLTSEGKLILFHILRTSDDSYTPETSSSEDYRSVGERTSAALSLKHQLPAVTLGLNDSAEVRESEHLQRLENNSNGNDTVVTGKEVQGSANSNAQLFSGRTLNGEKLPVVSPVQTVSTTLPVGILSNEAFTTMQVGTRILGQNVEKELVGSTGSQGVSFGSQSTGKLVFTNSSSAKSSSSALDRSVLGNSHSAKFGSEIKLPSSQHGPIFDDSLPGGKPFSWKVSSSSPSPPSVFSENKAIQSEEAKSLLVKKGSPGPLPAMHKPLPIMPQSSMPGKSLNSMTQPSLNNSRNSRSSWSAEPEPELSKQFYNVKDMAKELDKLLSFIEREGGFRDACTISQESSLSTLEDGLKDLSIMSHVHRNKIEKQLLEIQQLQNKMLQVSTRQVYVEGLVKQASNDQYWDIWKRQKLSPELELKRQRILDTYQCLTNELIGLERHFNNLEISKFGEHGGLHAGRRVLHASADPSRNGQSVQKMYNTLNSQLAAADQLSNCLSEQMAMLNINKQSVRHPTVVKELFESIGLPQEASIFHSPESIKRTSVSASITKGNSKINTSSASHVLESGTARRRYSLDKSLSKFEPQKTTVKRMLKESTVSVIPDKHVGRSREAFHSQTASYAIDPHKSNENHTSSFSQPSSLEWHSLAYPTGKGLQEKPPKEASQAQAVSPFKWTLELSGSSQNLKLKSHPSQPLSSSSSAVFYNNSHGIADGKFQLPDSSSNIATHVASQSSSSMVSQKAPSSKRTSDVPLNTSLQTSVAFPSSCTPIFKATLPSEIVHEKTSGQLNQQSGKDAPTKLSLRNSDNFGVSEKGLFSLSDESTHSMRSAVQSVDGNRIAEVDVLTGHSASPETSSTTPFNILASASTPVFSIKQSSTSLASSHSSTFISPNFPSLSINSSAPVSSSAMASIGKTSFDTKPIDDTSKTTPVPSSVLTPSTPPRLASSNPLTVQSHESPVPQPSAIPFESAVHSTFLQASIAKSNSESVPLPASKSEGLLQPTEINQLSKAAVSQAPAIKVSAGMSEESSVIPTAGFSTFPPTSGPPQIQSTIISPLSTISQEKDEGIDLSSSQEDEMEEEAPSMANEFLGGLGGFGLGTTSPHIPKSNPFGVSFNTTPASAPFSLTSSPGELFRPASFSIPPPKPIELSQPIQSGATSSGFGGGFSGFGQPANIGAGQQALGSVLGAFGQSRQIGGGALGTAGGFAGVAPGGGFTGAATGGFVGAATGGGGFAGAATGGGFASAATGGGFAAAAAGGGFAAVGSKGGGFAAAASGGSGGFPAAASGGIGGFGGANPAGGFAGGGFGAFSSNKGSGFSGFGGNNSAGAGGPPPQLFTQMRK